jgi:RNA-binding protein YhbY
MTPALMVAAERAENLRAHKKLVKTSLSRFIKYNQNLFHLNLSNTGLNESVLKKIGSSLSKARALVCVHLSGNPGINDKIIKYLKKRIKCKP